MINRFYIVAMLFACCSVLAQASDKNIARGKKVTFSRAPNYSYCTDVDDEKQLTDGVYTQGTMWVQNGAVGWEGLPSRIGITIDLGTLCPISGLSFSTGAGQGGVYWPAELWVFVSDDGEAWNYVGDLVQLSAGQGKPPKVVYAGQFTSYKFLTKEIEAHGRWVKIVAKALNVGGLVVVDEIEIYKGDNTLLQKPHSARQIRNEDFHAILGVKTYEDWIKAQFRSDLKSVWDDLGKMEPGNDKTVLAQKAEGIDREISQISNVPRDISTAVPMNDLERKIFKLQAEVWRAQGKSLLRVWKTHRWDPLGPSQEPAEPGTTPLICVRMMNNEFRSDVLNITNACDEDKNLRLKITGLPGGTNPNYITVQQVITAGNKSFGTISTGLVSLPCKGEDYLITVPAGMTRQVWFLFHPENLQGDAYGKVLIQEGQKVKCSAPVYLKVYPLRFPDLTSLYLSGWDYTNRKDGNTGLTAQNRDLLVSFLKRYYVNVPWADQPAMPLGRYDSTGKMVEKPDTREFDTHVARWKNVAKRYMTLPPWAGQDTFDGSKMGTALFEKKVANWLRFWTNHIRGLGLKPNQLGFLILDEAREESHYKLVSAWANEIKKIEPEIVLFEDPCSPEPSKALEIMVSRVDCLTPQRSDWVTRPQWFRDLFLNQWNEGKELGFYMCQGPSWEFDPYRYYLLQAWHCFAVHAKGSNFWSFSDTQGVWCWNEYLSNRINYCPFYLEKTAVTSTKQMEAIREGVEDYEYLTMLRDRIARLESEKLIDGASLSAKVFLEEACQRVLEAEPSFVSSWPAGDRTLADRVRVEALEILVKLKADDSVKDKSN